MPEDESPEHRRKIEELSHRDQRAAEITTRLAAVADGQTISIGIAECQPHESLKTLIARADGIMLEGRKRARG